MTIMIDSILLILSLLFTIAITILIGWPILLLIGKYCKWCYNKIIGTSSYEEYEEYDDRKY